MKTLHFRWFGLLILAVVFTAGLTFASIELPRLIDSRIQSVAPHPAVDSHGSPDQRFRTELFIRHYHLRAVGYGCFGLILLLIAAGFLTRRSQLASLGAVALFLPAFGQFALTMFYLAGLGLLQISWLPFLDISLDTMRLGEVIHVPLRRLNHLGHSLNIGLQTPFSILLIGLGALIFVIGVYAWLTARFQKQGVADFWIYRFSRHPQYLGWILWSYGVLICPIHLPNMKRSWDIDGSLAWLLSTMIIICVCLLEEIHMKQAHGTSYEQFRKRTPFLFPLPSWITRSLAWPGRVLFGKHFPSRRREVVSIVGIYTVLLLLLSYPASVLRPYVSAEEAAVRLAKNHSIAELVKMAEKSPSRWRNRHVMAVANHGKTGRAFLMQFLQHENAGLRECAIRELKHMANPPEGEFIRLLNDPHSAVQWAAITALGELKCVKAAPGIIQILKHGDKQLAAAGIGALSSIPVPEAQETLLKQMNQKDFWVRNSLAKALAGHPSAETRTAILTLLRDENVRVRRSAALGLIKLQDPMTQDALKQALQDPDWEVRLYAKEAMEQLTKTRR